ncbi:MAG: response regulator [Acidimicrobiia bacterium]|nr:response regulator [Actinomycetota bacterium]MBL6925180.1 response regulator [Acidimicrobiia bacterium]MBL6926227.1 response regulator [Acidimicrobiia bacterium]
MTSRRILIVDDEADIREVTRLSLEATMGWEVVTAGSGAEGLALAVQELPDAILLDMMMPVMGGEAVLARLKEDDALADVPVILFTAKVHPSDRSRYDGLGSAGLIVKPYDPLTLGGQVVEILGWE